jgi:hypothetical protein
MTQIYLVTAGAVGDAAKDVWVEMNNTRAPFILTVALAVCLRCRAAVSAAVIPPEQ